MYVPKLYRNENQQEILSFVEKNNFGILVTRNAVERTIATHIPFVISERAGKLILTSHISRANEQWKNFDAISECLVIFTGPHTYISSSWYDHVNVPTWNYIAVHVYGEIKAIGQEATLAHLASLVDQHEANEEEPVSTHSMGATYIAKEMQGLVAFEITAKEVYSAFKLSQNRDTKNMQQVTAALEKRGDENSLAIAAAMKAQRNR